MKFILDGQLDRDLINKIKEENLPVSHIIMHVPNNPMGNGSIFLPPNQITFDDFKSLTQLVQDNGIIPIAGLDSTCQGNFEAHAEHYKGIMSLLKNLQELGYNDILLSSPNNVGFFKENYPGAKIYLSYAQYTTSTNRAKIFNDVGAHSLILHPDVIRSFGVLKGFIQMRDRKDGSELLDFIIPLNIGCNWGCIYWYQHHNLQSHRTINSPVFPEQTNISDIENGFDYPLLNCWKNRLKRPENILKSGWISPYNITDYINLGYDKFYFSSYKMSNDFVINALKSFKEGKIDKNFLDLISIPYPYGDYWKDDYKLSSFFEFDSDLVKDFCEQIPYGEHYPQELKIDKYCNEFSKKITIKNQDLREKVLDMIADKINKIEKGTVQR
ncbi:MAG: hypothetical protein GF317_18015 [Candidatus Lokiarchaeota archaeon]|nr:hypothetical protein [Candidatus Lokiarchaeota archaeon]MBD3201409.1 hypothetical protein [Candidatus Lokiarchaeota archaeon]